MTQQSYLGDSNNEAASSCGSSIDENSTATVSSDVYPFSIGQKEIVLNNDERAVIAEFPDNNVFTPGTNICIQDSTNVDVGNRTVFNRPVTIYQYINPSTLPELQNGNAGQDEVQCNKNVRVIPPPSPTPSILPPAPSKPGAASGLYRRYFKTIMILLTVAAVICAVTLITLRLVGSKEPNFIRTTTIAEEVGTTPSPAPKIHYLFNKTQWGGRFPSEQRPMEEIPRLVIIKHTKTPSCYAVQKCFTAMQNLQNADVGEHLPDIRYNFVIGGDANIYVGRGWDVQNEQMNNTIDVAYMGDFNEEVPSEWLEGAGRYLVVMGMLNGHLDSSHTKVVCHNQTEATDSPGANLCSQVMLWPFYSNEIINGSTWNKDLH